MKFDNFSIQEPDSNVKVKDTFEIDSDLKVDSFSESNEYVPKPVSYTHLTLPTIREV